MKRWFLFFSLILFIALVFLPQNSFAKRTIRGPKEYTGDQTYKAEANFDGPIHYEPIIFNDYGQLRAWSLNYIPGKPTDTISSAITGYNCVSCYVTLEPGRLHIFDPQAIMESVNTAKNYDVGGTTGFNGYGNTGSPGGLVGGVTAIMFDADKYPYYWADVLMLTTGGTGYAHQGSAVTPVTVWPWPKGPANLSEVTNYSSGKYKPQSMLNISAITPYAYSSGTSQMVEMDVVSGGSNMLVRYPGTWVRYYAIPDSAVSVYPIPIHVRQINIQTD